MRVAMTGTSSTGKTTLAQRTASTLTAAGGPPYAFLSANARQILRDLGWGGIDTLDATQRCKFQHMYLRTKLRMESAQENFLTDRSFLDVAAYWLEYGCATLCPDDTRQFLETCRRGALLYDRTFYLPPGLLPFEADGYRSADMDMQQSVDSCIRTLAADWGVPLICVGTGELEQRIQLVLTAVKEPSDE